MCGRQLRPLSPGTCVLLSHHYKRYYIKVLSSLLQTSNSYFLGDLNQHTFTLRLSYLILNFLSKEKCTRADDHII